MIDDRLFWALNPEDGAFLVLVLAFVIFAGCTVFSGDVAQRGRAGIIAVIMLLLAVALHGFTVWWTGAP